MRAQREDEEEEEPIETADEDSEDDDCEEEDDGYEESESEDGKDEDEADTENESGTEVQGKSSDEEEASKEDSSNDDSDSSLPSIQPRGKSKVNNRKKQSSGKVSSRDTTGPKSVDPQRTPRSKVGQPTHRKSLEASRASLHLSIRGSQGHARARSAESWL